MKIRKQRKKLVCCLDVIDLQSKKIIGYLGNISKQGLMIFSKKLIPVNNFKHISIELPDFDEFTQKSIEIIIEVRWSKPDIRRDLRLTGCRFVRLDPKLLPIIEQVGELFKFE
ncbi:MAG: PilZ domain-containing protein [Bacteroidales bacterium]|nr:PilZ domain-containing protein [Bacteroidales bacterium]